MALLNPKALAFVPSVTATPLVSSTTPLSSFASPLGASSGLSPASQQVLASELEALGRRDARHARHHSEQQQQWGDGMMTMAQPPMYMYQPQTFEEIQQYQQLQAQRQTQYQQQYHPYEQTWMPSQHPIQARRRQIYQEIRGPASQSFVGTEHLQQTYGSPAQCAQSLTQFSDGRTVTTIYPPPPQPSQALQPGAQSSLMTRKQVRQMEVDVPANEIETQMLQGYNPEEVAQVSQPDNTYKRMIMAQYRASKEQVGLAFSSQPVYVPRVQSEYQRPDHQQPPTGSRKRPVRQQLPVYVHSRDLGEVSGYDGYRINPEQKIVRPDRVFVQVEESTVPANGPRVRLPGAESRPAHLHDHNGGIPRFNPNLTPTRRRTDDGRNADTRSYEGYDLANEFQQHHQRHQTTTISNNANEERHRQHQSESDNTLGQNGNQSRKLQKIRAAEQIVRTMTESRSDRGLCSGGRTISHRSHDSEQERSVDTVTTTTAAARLAPGLGNHGDTTAVPTVSTEESNNITTTRASARNIRKMAPQPQNRAPTLEELSFGKVTTSPIRTYAFPYAPTTASGQPLNLSGSRQNPLASISDRVARGETVPSDTMNPHNLAIQTVVSQMEANARAAAAGGRGEITYMDRGRYWVERKKAGKNAWDMEEWKVGGSGGPNREKEYEQKKGQKAGGQEAS